MNELQSPAVRPGAYRDRTGAILGRLAELGVTVPLAREGAPLVGEVSLKVSATALCSRQHYVHMLRQRLRRLAADGARVCLQPVFPAGSGAVASAWQETCERLASLFPNRSDPPAVSVYSHQLTPEQLAGLAADPAPFSSCYVYCDSLQMQSHNDGRVQARAESNWRALWRTCLMPVYGGFVRSICPLLADEAAAAVMPVTGLNVPRGSAWLALRVNLAKLADASGRLDTDNLVVLLDEAIPLADELLDRALPATAAQRRDATDNRRLAFLLEGIGDLVARRARDPADFACLHELQTEIFAIREAINLASAREARRLEPLPALSLPFHEWFEGQQQARWRQHFEAARRRAAVRHRNLLAMSPYSVLRSQSACDPAYADLLPLLTFADAWAFSGGHRFEGWNLSQFKDFHRRARAIIQSSQATTRIAAGA
jgi:hypothetical protein